MGAIPLPMSHPFDVSGVSPLDPQLIFYNSHTVHAYTNRPSPAYRFVCYTVIEKPFLKHNIFATHTNNVN